ncbi:MAG: 30S ribosomal protein S6 [Planctomycetota bacterium]
MSETATPDAPSSQAPAGFHSYEGMFLFDSAQFASDPEGISGKALACLEKCGAEVVAHRPWQDGRLPYEIAGRKKGLHYLIMFHLDPARMTELERACKLEDKILRQMFIRHEQVLFDANVAMLQPAADAE